VAASAGGVTVLRFTVSAGAAPLPPIDLSADVIEIGSAPDCRVRLPGTQVGAHHARIERAAGGWRLVALDPLVLDARSLARGEVVDLAPPARVSIGAVVVEIAVAAGEASAPARTASLAREVIRAMVASAGGAPELVVEAGPAAGARCALDPPPSRLVIGRGEDADWIVLDPDLSRAHVAVERSWDGITVVDLDSKNGTRVGGAPVGAGAELVHDGVIEAGGTRIRFTDPAARYLAELSRPPTLATPGPASAPAPAPAPDSVPAPASAAPFWIAIAICGLALAGLVWVLV
jgi:pSer/pThr/pTyr-binding forkhead associated (FHA) protein